MSAAKTPTDSHNALASNGPGTDPPGDTERTHAVDLDELDAVLSAYSALSLSLQRDSDKRTVLETGEWVDLDHGAHLPLTVDERVTPYLVAGRVDAAMDEQLRESPAEMAKAVYREAKLELAGIGAGIGAPATAYLSGEPALGEAAGVPGSLVAGYSGKRLVDKFGPSSTFQGIKHLLDEGELPHREVFANLKANTLDNMYLVDVTHRERDTGYLGELVDECGIECLEEQTPLDGHTYAELARKPESELDGEKFVDLVWDQTDDHRKVEQVVDEYTDVEPGTYDDVTELDPVYPLAEFTPDAAAAAAGV